MLAFIVICIRVSVNQLHIYIQYILWVWVCAFANLFNANLFICLLSAYTFFPVSNLSGMNKNWNIVQIYRNVHAQILCGEMQKKEEKKNTHNIAHCAQWVQWVMHKTAKNTHNSKWSWNCAQLVQLYNNIINNNNNNKFNDSRTSGRTHWNLTRKIYFQKDRQRAREGGSWREVNMAH